MLKMVTMLMLFFGIAVTQAAVRMVVGHELSVVPVMACLFGIALIMKGILRALLWIAREPSR